MEGLPSGDQKFYSYFVGKFYHCLGSIYETIRYYGVYRT